jgi:hypothetical protein
MMRKITSLLPLAIALGMALPAAAQSTTASLPETDSTSGPVAAPLTTQNLSIEGSAPTACSIRVITLNPGSAATLTSATQGNALVTLGTPNFVDPQTAVPTGGRVFLGVPIICNGAHTVIVRSTNGRLTLESGAAGGNGFRNAVDYSLTTSWAGLNQSFNTQSTSSLQIPVSQANSGDALVTIDIPSGGQPLVAGVYSDLIVVEVTVSS